MTMKFTWFYPDVVGIESNGVKLRMEHSLIFGFWRARENMAGWNSNENAEETAKALRLDVRDYKNKRSELAKAGLITVVKGAHGEIVKVHTVDDNTVFSFIQSMKDESSVSLYNEGASSHNETGIGVATPISNNNRNKEYGPSLAGASSGPILASREGSFSSLTDGEQSEPNPMGTPAEFVVNPTTPDPSLTDGEQSEPSPMGAPAEFVVNPTTPDPFGQPVKEQGVLSVKPEKNKTGSEDARAWAIVGKILDKCEAKGMKVNRKNIKLKTAVKYQLVKCERKEEDLMFALDKYLTTDDKFYSPSSKSIEAVFSQDLFEVYLNMDYKPKQVKKSLTF